MSWYKRIALPLFVLLVMLTACSVSYKFNGASINYDLIKTITIEEVDNRAPLVYPPLAPLLTEDLRMLYRRQTRLEQVRQNGDLYLVCSVVGYDLTPVAVQEDAYAALTKFTMSVTVDYENLVDPDKSFTGKSFTASVEFDSSQLFSDIQDNLIKELSEDIIKQIFNATVEDW